MAIYHLSTKPISRGHERSATAAAAYRSGELVHDLTTDEVFDYTRKRGVEHTEIVLPSAAAKMDINWARARESLWNAAELAEKRKDARVAREYEVALPHELSASQRATLVRAFSSDLANRYGVAVDFSIHAPHREGDDRNHHAHIFTTTRRETATGLSEKASIEWSDTDPAKKGLGPSKVELKAVGSAGRCSPMSTCSPTGTTARLLDAIWWRSPKIMDDETRKIAMLIAAFEDEQARLNNTVEKVARSAVLLQREVRNAARGAVEAALKELHPHVDRAGKTLVDLQRLSLWRAAWQHAMVAAVAVAVTLLAVWWYVPPRDEIAALRSERDQLQASVDDLKRESKSLDLVAVGTIDT